jgi:hypothetical protein
MVCCGVAVVDLVLPQRVRRQCQFWPARFNVRFVVEGCLWLELRGAGKRKIVGGSWRCSGNCALVTGDWSVTRSRNQQDRSFWPSGVAQYECKVETKSKFG